MAIGLKARLVGGIAVLLGVQVISSGYGTWLYMGAEAETEELVETYVAEAEQIAHAKEQLLLARSAEKNYFAQLDKRFVAGQEKAVANTLLASNKVAELAPDPARVGKAKTLAESVQSYSASFAEAARLVEARGLTEKVGLRGALRAAVHAVETELKTLEKPALTVLMLMCRRHEKDYLLRGASKYLDRVDTRIEEFEAELARQAVEAGVSAKMMGLMREYRGKLRELAAGDQALAGAVKKLEAAALASETHLQELAEASDQAIHSQQKLVLADLARGGTVGIIVALIALALGGLVLQQIFRGVLRPLQRLQESLTDMVSGSRDLRRRVTEAEMGEFAQCNNSLAERLEEMVAQVQQRSNLMDQSSQEISRASQATSLSASEQAASLQEISAAINQISGNTKQTLDDVKSAGSMAQEARQQAEDGQRKIDEMSGAMQDTREASNSVGSVIKVIEDIAFQTNLLALNAAVEAARAGEAGRGFSVVAEEVRSLAQRSAEAVKDTSDMITSVQDGVSRGARLMEEVNSSFRHILERSTDVDRIMGEVGNAANNQAEGIQQIGQGMHRLDESTQSTAAQSEELAASAQESSTIAVELRALTEGYVVRELELVDQASQPVATTPVQAAPVKTAPVQAAPVRTARAEPSLSDDLDAFREFDDLDDEDPERS